MKQKTVFIVGAGASSEVGLPVGETLKEIIASKLSIKLHPGTNMPSDGDRNIFAAIAKKNGLNTPQADVVRANAMLQAARSIAQGLTLADSIDQFLESHEENENIRLCGKLAIARAILEAERGSTLFGYANRNSSDSGRTTLEDTWYWKFGRLVFDGSKQTNLERLFENVTVITFNYDRCIEQFLPNAIEKRFLVTEAASKEIANTLTIFHPYGKVGGLPWQREKTSIEFGAEVQTDALLEIAAEIRVYTENVKDQDNLEKMHTALAEAERVVFLGFGFNRQNLDLLRHKKQPGTKAILGTAFGISEEDINSLSPALNNVFSGTGLQYVIKCDLLKDVSCNDFFTQRKITLQLG